MSPIESISKPLIALATVLTLSTPALADPTVGLGLTFSFGGGKPQTGVGLRVFSDNLQGSFVGSVGVDYMFGSQSFRGTVGGAYLGSNTYIGLDMGLGLDGSGFGLGLSGGAVGTKGKLTVEPRPEA
jgi:hypothetical protein